MGGAHRDTHMLPGTHTGHAHSRTHTGAHTFPRSRSQHAPTHTCSHGCVHTHSCTRAHTAHVCGTHVLHRCPPRSRHARRRTVVRTHVGTRHAHTAHAHTGSHSRQTHTEERTEPGFSARWRLRRPLPALPAGKLRSVKPPRHLPPLVFSFPPPSGINEPLPHAALLCACWIPGRGRGRPLEGQHSREEKARGGHVLPRAAGTPPPPEASPHPTPRKSPAAASGHTTTHRAMR